jgi:hypothetical protein
MKKNLILIFAIVGSAAIHLGIFVPLLLIVSGLVPLTESSVAILFAATVVNVLALVKLHTWNSLPNS